MALEHFGKVLAKSELVDSENKQSLYLDHHIKTLFEKFDDWLKVLKNFNFKNKAECLNRDDFKKAIAKAIFLHDLGKISYEFQDKITKSALNRGIINDSERKEILEDLKGSKDIKLERHEIYSCIWSLLFLPENDYLSSKVRTAILYHHENDFYGINLENGIEVFEGIEDKVADYLEKIIKPNKDKICKVIDELKQENFSDIIKNTLNELLSDFEKKYKIIDNIIQAFREKENISNYFNFYEPGLSNVQVNRLSKDDYEFFMLLGLLRRCDYSGSANVDIENPSDNVLDELEKQVKNFSWQSKLINNIDNTKHTILVAPTGSGKTEFAFLWAAQDKRRKLIYTLPLRVALNDIYNIRLKEKYLKSFSDFDKFVNLLHSTAFLEYISELKNESIDIENKENSSKLLNSALILSTADQVLLSSLFYYGFDKVFSIYPYSSFVIDEIQSYTPEMIAVILKTLHHIDELGGRILIMTATLPPFLEKTFKLEGINLSNKFQNLEEQVKNIADEVKNFNLKRHKLKVIEDSLIEITKQDKNYLYKANEDVISEIKNKSKNNNILIIFNNIGKAIEFYKKLCENLNNKDNNKEKIFLLHSRLLEKEKREKICSIKEKLENGEKGLILISTQIVEASVDIDFDLLYTEISPIDSQIQRWGRIYRNRNKNYSDKVPNIFIYIGKENNEEQSLRFSKIIYSQEVLEATISYFKNNSSDLNNKVLSYEDEKNMINDVFTHDVLNRYIDSIKNNLEFLSYIKTPKRSEAQRIFRKLAGRYVVFIDVMKEYGNDIEKKLANFILKQLKNGVANRKWEEICKEIYTNYNPNQKYEIKKILLDYSINIPEFYFSKLLKGSKVEKFKGFYIYSGLKKENLLFLKEQGFDAIKEEIEIQELEFSEIDQFI